ncbi:hypothetical protein AX16_010304 [Volvariella volvacea WC 439]|nr:hypothetical protein AX16_010304 [Volvariella volvacea WC 439]
MKWRQLRLEYLLVILVAVLQGPTWWRDATQASSPIKSAAGWTAQRKLAARERTRELWYHGYDNYMSYAFPLDELTPLSCSGQGPDWGNPQNIASNDVAGNFSLTLIDVLDTFVVLDDRQNFELAVKNVIQWVSFDVNTKPQVFETTIRVLGGLLSGHIFANSSDHPFHLPWYRGELLDLAYDLGERLLPAFATPTGLPYARINLRHGLMKGETVETCTAGAGSLILEFATLSRLTGDSRFERAARKAFFGLWNRKSNIGLVGNQINTWTGSWMSPEVSGIGAGVDSFYEYALKWYIMSGESEFLDVWDDAYAAIMRYSRSIDGYWYRTVNMHSGDAAYNTVDSLSAFWPGLQVLAGDIQSAIKLHMLYYNLWRAHSGLPEVYDTNYKKATSHQYPLRPELVESTWYLYRATRDPFYLDVGERILFDLTTRAKVECGLTGIQDLRTNKRDDRMESFALSETLKYLYLLFDEDNALHNDDSNYVFTTEGHILTLGKEYLRPQRRKEYHQHPIDSHQCPTYQPFVLVYDSPLSGTGLRQGIKHRPDVEYARELVGNQPSRSDMGAWSPYGWCEQPKVDIYAFDVVLSANGRNVPEDLSPSLLKLGFLPNGYVINNITGIRTHIVKRLDGRGFDIRKLGHYTVRPGQLVYINDTSLFLEPTSPETEDSRPRDVEIQIQLYGEGQEGSPVIHAALLDLLQLFNVMNTVIVGYAATFGADLSAHQLSKTTSLPLFNPDGVLLHRDSENELGCEPYQRDLEGAVVVALRGGCTFLDKLANARDGGALGVVVISDEDGVINPTANSEELVMAGDLSNVGIILVSQKMGKVVLGMMETAKQVGGGKVKILLHPNRESSNEDADEEGEGEGEQSNKSRPEKILYLNGHPLVNTRLLV